MPIHHKSQAVGFLHPSLPFTLSGLNRFLSSANRKYNTGGLIEYLCNQLKDSPKLLSVKQRFSLMNCTSVFNSHSHGYSEVPPIQVWPPHAKLLFTFSLASEDYDLQEVQPDVILHPTLDVCAWGYGNVQFVTVGLDGSYVQKFGLTNLYSEGTDYLFNVIGAALKNIVREGHVFSLEDQLVTAEPSVADIAVSPLMLFNKVPYSRWVFNSYVWKKAPNLLHPSSITPSTVTYYFRYLSGSFRNVRTTDGSYGSIYGFPSAKSGILKVLCAALRNFLQRLRSGDFHLQTDEDYLIPLLLLSAVADPGNSVTTISIEKTDVDSSIDLFDEHALILGNLLSDVDQFAFRLLEGDPSLSADLLQFIE